MQNKPELKTVARENTIDRSVYFKGKTLFDVVAYVAEVHYELKRNHEPFESDKYDEAKVLISEYKLENNVSDRISDLMEADLSENSLELNLEQGDLKAGAENLKEALALNPKAIEILKDYSRAYQIIDAFREKRDEWRTRANDLIFELSTSSFQDSAYYLGIMDSRISLAREQAEHFARAMEFAESVIEKGEKICSA